MDRLLGKTALITAAAQGIGHATATAFRREGASVLATDINAAGLQGLAADTGVDTAVLDVTDGASITALAAQYQPDILFNCAGFVHHGSILDCSDDDFDFSMNLNVISMFRTIRAFLPSMIQRGGGSIVNMASVASSIKGTPNRCIYGITKAAVIGLTKSVAADYVGAGVRCNAICPGTIQTPSLETRINAFDDPGRARADFISRQPMGRLGTPEEIASLAVYLAADESGFTTGTINIVDGGWAI